jgi:ketosteroid isomerase-like protein
MPSDCVLDLAQTTPAPGVSRRSSILAGLAGITALAANASAAEEKGKKEGKEENPEREKIHALLKAHDEAVRNQDVSAILALMAEKSAVMGTGPGEIWSGPEELKGAYEHFFQGFDKGEQKYEYDYKLGNVGTDMGWFMTSGNIKGKKDGKEFEFPINISLTVSKAGGKWLIAALHFSTFATNETESEDKK